jgi:uncharacterized metal-binding protein YceD (DUF177 family)
MEIKISNLGEGEHIYNFETDAEELEVSDLNFEGKIKIKVVLDKVGTLLNLDVNCKGYDYSGELIDSDEINEDNIKYIDPHTHKIDITNDVRDYLILNVPMKRTHDENDENCKQIRKSDSDESKGINPVWEKLTKNKNN